MRCRAREEISEVAVCRQAFGYPQRTGRMLRVRQSGVVLPIVLLISAMMLATPAVWFETSLAAARSATNVRDYLQAFHAADSALISCARSVIAAAGETLRCTAACIRRADAMETRKRVRSGRCRTCRAMARIGARAAMFDRTVASCQSRRCSGVFADFTRLRAHQRLASLAADGAGDRRVRQIERHWRRVAARPF